MLKGPFVCVQFTTIKNNSLNKKASYQKYRIFVKISRHFPTLTQCIYESTLHQYLSLQQHIAYLLPAVVVHQPAMASGANKMLVVVAIGRIIGMFNHYPVLKQHVYYSIVIFFDILLFLLILKFLITTMMIL